jgi:methylated-DNA-protein-cysteine methyltransferase-like protein
MEDIIQSQPARSAFNAAVWKIAREIPPGKVFTYGQISALIPTPSGVSQEVYLAYRARWAGQAMAASPADVPWQRVVNSQGKISPRRGADVQRWLLESEGVVFDDRQRIDLARFGWAGPDKEWLKANDLVVPHKDQESLF